MLKNILAQVLTGPPGPTEPNSSGFNRACPICGWESEETVEATSTKFAKCPKCGATIDQPFIINSPPTELELLTPQVAKEKDMNKNAQAQAVQTVDPNALMETMKTQGINLDPAIAEQVAKLIEEQMKSRPEQPQSPMKPALPMQPIGMLAKILEKAWGDEPARTNFEPGFEPPRLAEADEKDDIDMFHEDKDEQKELDPEEAKALGEKIGIEWANVKFTPEALAEGFKHELEHGNKDPETNVTDDDPEKTAKIAWAHLKEDPDYYVKLSQMENEVESDKEEKEKENEEEIGENDHLLQASLRRHAVTVRELREVVLPQLEEDFFSLDAALQSGNVEEAREHLHDAYSRFYVIQHQIENLGDVDPVVYAPPEKDKGFLSKIGL
jgi:hypothetical protein